MADLDGKWDLVIDSTQLGAQSGVLAVEVASSGDSFTGTFSSQGNETDVKDGKVDGDAMTWNLDVTVPMPMTLNFTTTVTGDKMTGTVKAGEFGSYPLTGTRT